MTTQYVCGVHDEKPIGKSNESMNEWDFILLTMSTHTSHETEHRPRTGTMEQNVECEKLNEFGWNSDETRAERTREKNREMCLICENLMRLGTSQNLNVLKCIVISLFV